MNALRVLFRNWITKYSDGHELVKDLEGEPSVERNNPYGEVVLGFGKFRGSRLKEVDPSYLLRVLDNFENLWPETRRAIERFLGESK
jgi:hypothetical protein